MQRIRSIRTISIVTLIVAGIIAAIAIAVAPAFAAGSGPTAGSRSSAPVTKPPVVKKYISYGAGRKRQTADYCRRHYGVKQATYVLSDPKAVVLHHTDGADWRSAWCTFDANTAYTTPAGKEKPGVSAQFIIAKDGTIYQLMPLSYRARHCIGMNYVSFGIEFCQESAGHDGHWMERQILNRPAQVNAGLKLVRWLQYKYGIKTSDVVGHATANESPCFLDKTGIRNGAGDWFAAELKIFKSRL
jgi:N-acetyl-anhydromuramyl-L-alanine amidase AmpD